MQGRLENEIKMQKKIDKLLNTMPEYVKEWYTNLKASRTTMSTCKDYISKIKKFLSYIDEDTKNIPVTSFSLQVVESYLISVQTKRNKDGSISYTSDSYQITIWCALNNLFTFLYSRKYIDEIYTSHIHKPKNNDLDRINEKRVLLTQKDFKKIIKVIQNGGKGKKQFRDKFKNRDLMIMSLFMSTGIRKTALTEINVSDFDIDNMKLKVIDKGNKTHYYPLNETLVELYYSWIEERLLIANDNQDALFINYNGDRISVNGITKIVKKYTSVALGKGLSPHKLRAGFCSILYENTHDAEFVRRAVGHSNIQTTQRYIRTNNDEREIASNIMEKIIQ